MNSRQTVVVMIGNLALGMGASSAVASPVTWEFAGTITSVRDDGDLFGGAVVVGGLVAVGETRVIEPSTVVGVDGELPVSSSATLERVSRDVPSATVENSIVVRMPAPFGPAPAPVVEQPNVTLFAPVVGAGQFTLRPVEPRNGPFVALMNDSMDESQVRVKS